MHDNDTHDDDDGQAGPPWSRPKAALAEQEAAKRDEAARLGVVAIRVAEMRDTLLPAGKRLEAARRLLRGDLVGLLTADERAYAEAVVANFCRPPLPVPAPVGRKRPKV
ncbi:hypothetical protein [Telmatospirillum siberiense]|uniref:Uncharacterized protein n=1 Tax=Telmatospirillum siberiense TaxID=382514 RepID=A0A2N3PXK7_9PROT|nr:hypothetical protein [Telmatospirillum siberiense]PKU25111.1 hypothetical protein CWS72_07890 [Telmatospirillum siberiense]